MTRLLLVLAFSLALSIAGVAAAAPIGTGVGPVGIQCTGAAFSFTLGVPPTVSATPPTCSVTGLPA